MSILTEQEEAICRAYGTSEKEYIATRTTEEQLALDLENSMTPAKAREKLMRLMGLNPAEIEKREAEEAKRFVAYGPLSEEELKVCRAMGVEPSDYYRAKQKDSE
ncbi:hypothetical protein KAR91_08465 [Candidatus Pacearchaeota archaeon]|nr:hypothetical protein [Candidatus Pacearchaeota archaeon]